MNTFGPSCDYGSNDSWRLLTDSMDATRES